MASELAPTASQLPIRKRKKADGEDEDAANLSSDDGYNKVAMTDASKDSPSSSPSKPLNKRPLMLSKGRAIRLEQNRVAARESRKRKKVMIEELQRSVIFFSRANGTLKHQNDDLTRLLMQAQSQVAVIESAAAAGHQQTQATETQIAAATVPQNMQVAPSVQENASVSVPSMTTSGSLPPMQPGATMQAMANFQQAAAAAMQAAVKGLQSIPGVSLQSLTAAAPTGTNAQQAYNDTMTALAMQQAAVAAAASGQTFNFQNAVAASAPFMSQHHLAAAGWENQYTSGAPATAHQASTEPTSAPAPTTA